MDILIVNKYVDETKLEELSRKSKPVGSVFSQERYYTWLNNQIDCKLKMDHKIVYILVTFFMRSANFRHETFLVYKKPFWVVLIDLLCWMCLIAFFIFLATGVAAPLIKAVAETIKLVQKPDDVGENLVDVWKKAFSSDSIIFIVLSIFTLLIAIGYFYIMTKVVPKNKALTIKDYVYKKIDYISKFSPWIKTEQRIIKKTKKIKNKLIKKNIHLPLIVFTKAETLSDTDRWLSMQVLNMLNKIFYDFKIAILFQGLDEEVAKKIITINKSDFLNNKIIQFEDVEKEWLLHCEEKDWDCFN